MTQVAALYRLSTKKQAARKGEDELDIPGQRRAVESFLAARPGWTLAVEFEEAGISAFKKRIHERPVLLEILEGAKAGRFSVLCVFREDRLSRGDEDSGAELLYILSELERSGVQVWSVSDQKHLTVKGTQLVIRAVEADSANQESKKTSSRVRNRMTQLAEKGRWTGGPVPFGYKLTPRTDANGQLVFQGGRLIRDLKPGEHADIVREMFRRYAAGEGTMRLTKWLNSLGIPSPTGKQWSRDTVSLMIENPLYIGLLAYNRRKDANNPENQVLAHGQHEALIDMDTWEQAQRLKAARTELPNRQQNADYVLSGILKCSKCKGNMGGIKRRFNLADGARKEYLYYRCVNRKHKGTCKMSDIPAGVAEAEFVKAMAKVVLPGQIRSYLEQQADADSDRLKEYQATRKSAQDRLKQIDQALARVDAAYFESGVLTDAEYKQRKDRYEAERKAVQEELAKPAPAIHRRDLSTLVSELQDIEANWPYLTPEERKAFALAVTTGWNIRAILTDNKTVDLEFL